MDKTYKFVAETNRAEYFKLRARENMALMDAANGEIRPEFADPIDACLLCGSHERSVLFRKEGFDFLRCHICSFIYANPQILEDKLMRSYEDSSANDAWIDVLLSSVNMQYDVIKFNNGLNRIESVTGGTGRVLDVGCSIGLFLKSAKERGWEAIGLEMNSRAVQYARENWALEIKKSLLHEAAFADESFDAVTLWGVLEHLKRPVQVISEVYRILKPGGVLLTFCPNVESLVCRVLHERTSCFDGRNHCGYFSPASASFLLKKCGFEILEIQSYQPELDTVLNYLNFDEPYVKESNVSNPIKKLFAPNLFDHLEKYLLDNKLGYKFQTLAQKKN